MCLLPDVSPYSTYPRTTSRFLSFPSWWIIVNKGWPLKCIEMLCIRLRGQDDWACLRAEISSGTPFCGLPQALPSVLVGEKLVACISPKTLAVPHRSVHLARSYVEGALIFGTTRRYVLIWVKHYFSLLSQCHTRRVRTDENSLRWFTGMCCTCFRHFFASFEGDAYSKTCNVRAPVTHVHPCIDILWKNKHTILSFLNFPLSSSLFDAQDRHLLQRKGAQDSLLSRPFLFVLSEVYSFTLKLCA